MATSQPHRRCIGCRQSRPQDQLLRFTRRGDGEVRLCRGPRKGRGAYMCPQENCAKNAWRGGRWERAFRARVRPCGDVELFWSELLSALVQPARFLYRSSLTSEIASGVSPELSREALSELVSDFGGTGTVAPQVGSSSQTRSANPLELSKRGLPSEGGAM